MDEHYLKYDVEGLQGIRLDNNDKRIDLKNNPYIKEIYLNDDLSELYVYLKEGVDYKESKDSNFRLVVVNNKNLPSCITNNNDTNFMLQKGQSCYLGFTFAPDRNADFTKKIIIMSNSGERREVTLKGTGIEKLQEN